MPNIIAGSCANAPASSPTASIVAKKSVIYEETATIPKATPTHFAISNNDIGMDHKDFEAGIGQIYVAQSEPESDYTLPTAWIDFEAKGANEAEKGNYSLMVLEDSEQVVYALLYKQAD